MKNEQALVDGVLAIVKAATEPLFHEITLHRAEIAALKAGVTQGGTDARDRALLQRVEALEQAIGLKGRLR